MSTERQDMKPGTNFFSFLLWTLCYWAQNCQLSGYFERWKDPPSGIVTWFQNNADFSDLSNDCWLEFAGAPKCWLKFGKFSRGYKMCAFVGKSRLEQWFWNRKGNSCQGGLQINASACSFFLLHVVTVDLLDIIYCDLKSVLYCICACWIQSERFRAWYSRMLWRFAGSCWLFQASIRQQETHYKYMYMLVATPIRQLDCTSTVVHQYAEWCLFHEKCSF